MAGFGEQLQAAAPMFLGIGSQLSGNDPMGIARGMALMQAKSESDKRKAAINNMLSGMGIAGPQKAFLESMPPEAQQQWILQQMAPKPRNLQVINGVVVDMDAVEPGTNFNPTMQPLPPGLFGEGGGAGYNVGGNVRMQGVSDPAMQAWNTFASGWSGPELNVTSAYRDPNYNSRVGGAKNSQHTHGNAFDFSTSGWTQEQKQAAVQRALDAGFTGVGVYGDSLHFDTGPRRVWGPSYGKESAPEWATAMVMGGGASAPPVSQQAQKSSADDARVDTLTRNINAVTGLLASGWNRDYPEARQGLEYRRKQWEDELRKIEERRKEVVQAAKPQIVEGADGYKYWVAPGQTPRRVIEGIEGPPETDPIAALRARADAAGLTPGSPEYRKFMINGGAAKGLALNVGADGSVSFATDDAAGGVKFGEAESKTNTYVVRARGALEVLDQVGAEHLTDRADALLEKVPFGIGREVQSDDYQVARQSGDEFLQAILRKDTGAAITPGEQTLYGGTYLPQPGDGDPLLEAKRAARLRAVAAMEAGMSPAQQVAVDRAIINSERRIQDGKPNPATKIADKMKIDPTAINMLLDDPSDEQKANFDAVFGAGSAAQVLEMAK